MENHIFKGEIESFMSKVIYIYILFYFLRNVSGIYCYHSSEDKKKRMYKRDVNSDFLKSFFYSMSVQLYSVLITVKYFLL